MKRFLQRSSVLLLFSCLSSTLFAQLPMIQNLSISPAYPNTHDNVKIISQTVFASGDCELTSSSVSVYNGIIDVYANHTLGMLTYICSSTDTISLGMLESGNYKLRYHLSCMPYSPNTDLDSVSFTVQTYTGRDMKENVKQFTLFPNPAQDKLIIQFPENTSGTEICVLDQLGKELLRVQTSEAQKIIYINDLAKGMYIIKVISGTKNGFQKFIKF
jgi:hypothetical protein